MDDQTAAALEESIAHWKENALATEPNLAKVLGSSCALCKLFCPRPFHPDREECEGCPVAQRTGMPSCERSPWEAAYHAHSRWLGHASRWNEFRIAALAEVTFLESLRDKPIETAS